MSFGVDKTNQGFELKKQKLLALSILAVVIGWMAIPREKNLVQDESATSSSPRIEISPEGSSGSEDPGTFVVRAQRISPESYVRQIRVRGRTQAFRHVEVRAEEAGRIVKEPVERGSRVKEGDVLCEVAIDNRQVNLSEASSRLEQAEFEYLAALDLQERGLQSDVIVAQLKAALESSRASVARAELAVAKTQIVAPFDGIVETRAVELGDLLNIGTVCASILDDTPMLLIGLVPEQEVRGLNVGASVTGQLLTGELVQGTVSYIARAADAISRSYRIEIEVDERYRDLRAGITVELLVDSENLNAYRIPPSALTLDDNGQVGVKVLNPQNTVEFFNVEIAGDETNQLEPGIWITGLSGNITLITVGQEIVFPGQTVDANFDWDS